jgi:hypothetical protein
MTMLLHVCQLRSIKEDSVDAVDDEVAIKDTAEAGPVHIITPIARSEITLCLPSAVCLGQRSSPGFDDILISIVFKQNASFLPCVYQ